MKLKSIFIFLIIVHCTLGIVNCSNAQGKYNNNWVTGAYHFTHLVNFDSTNPKTIYYDSTHSMDFTGAHSCISDSNGNIILMCTGSKLFNASKLIIENGDTLINKDQYLYFNGIGAVYASQGSIIILPFDSQLFKIFTPTYLDGTWSNTAMYNLLNMHVIDMKINNGLGRVIQKKIAVTDTILYARVGMTACRHANGKDWWIAKQGAGLGIDANNIYTFYVSKDSIAKPIKNSFSTPKYNGADRSGQMQFNQQGTQIANLQEEPNQVFVANFDRCLGVITNPKVYNIPALPINNQTTVLETLPRGLCFSPNGQFLYVVMRSKVFQLDLMEPDSALAWYLVSDIDTIWAQFNQYNTAQLAPNNKIYIGNWAGFSNAMNVIDNPDVKGAGCNWCNRCLRFLSVGVADPPNQINYNLGASPTLCYPLDTGNIKIDSMQLYVNYQNSSNQLTISIAKNTEKKLDVFSAQGALVYSQVINVGAVKVNVDASSWAKGVYVVRVGGQSKKVIIN
jgi:hypothetical protein